MRISSGHPITRTLLRVAMLALPVPALASPAAAAAATAAPSTLPSLALAAAVLALIAGVTLLARRRARQRRDASPGVPAPLEGWQTMADDPIKAAIRRAADEARNPWMAAALRAHADMADAPAEPEAARRRQAADRQRALWSVVRLG